MKNVKMGKSKIEWCDKVWNPITGCTKISEGCGNCYAERMARRLAGRCGYPKDNPFAVTLHPERLNEPLRWKKPQRVFVCSMGDLFHKDVKQVSLMEIFMTIRSCPQHTFLILTKRAKEMCQFFWRFRNIHCSPNSTPNLWLGVSVENQKTADKRIPLLLQIPAIKRFVSYEPALGPVNFMKYIKLPGHGSGEFNFWIDLIDWIIMGGESGPGARPMKIEWARDVKNQCVNAGIPFFYKQGPGDDGKVCKMPMLDGRRWRNG